VYAFSRGYYKENTFPEGCRVISLDGTVSNGRYLTRIAALVSAIQNIRQRELKLSEPSLVYAFGLDNALVASIAFRRQVPMVYEFGDIRQIQLSKGAGGKIVRWLERRILSRTLTVVVTAEAHYTYYLKNIHKMPRERVTILENRVSRDLLKLVDRPVTLRADREGPLSIGVVGNLRYAVPTKNLLDALTRTSRDIEFHVFGDGPEMGLYNSYSSVLPNMKIHGPFRNPADLATIYKQIDLNVVLYDPREENVRWAIPNKLFESAYFGVPAVASMGTQFADRLQSWGIGYAIDSLSVERIIEFLEQVCVEDIRARAQTALRLPEEMIVENERELERVLTVIADGNL
jgi:succinoglycan biosynthesis protein ExoL